MPSMLHIWSTDIEDALVRLPSDIFKNAWATSITFFFPVPVLSRIAISSALLNEDAPLLSIFSLGLSSEHRSLIFISLLRLLPHKRNCLCKLNKKDGNTKET